MKVSHSLAHRIAISFALTATLIFTSMAPTCSKSSLVASANDVFTALSDAQPFIARLLPGKAAKFATAVAEAKKLVDAIKASDKTTALALVSAIFPVIDEIAKDLGANAQVMTILALANIALHFIVNHVASTAPALATMAGAVAPDVTQFKNAPTWGCGYRKTDKRCQP